MHDQAGIPSPTDLMEGKDLLAKMEKTYSPEGAPTVDPVQFLPAVYNTIQFAHNRRKKKHKVMKTKHEISRNWFAFLLLWVMFGRPSEACEYCPAVESVHFPTDIVFDVDGLPPYLIIDLLQWKNRVIGKGRYQMKIIRNKLNGMFCPVFWLLYWLALSGLTAGPLITRLIPEANNFVAPTAVKKVKTPDGIIMYQTEDGLNVGISHHSLESSLVTAFREAGFVDSVLYTIRKTATMMGARCGGRHFALLATGRWKANSHHFSQYIQSGVSDSEKYPNKEDDPLRKLWVYAENVETIVSRPKETSNKPKSATSHCDGMKEAIAGEEKRISTFLDDDVRAYLTNFRAEYVDKYHIPNDARLAFERNMDKHGVRIDIDRTGLLNNNGYNNTYVSSLFHGCIFNKYYFCFCPRN